jgi:hypothetical protein
MSKTNKKSKILSMNALDKVLSILPPKSSILDIGAGEKQIHANKFREYGYNVDTVDFFDTATYQGDFNTISINKQYNCIWASHCLEHQLNVNNFLVKCFNIVEDLGYIVVTVPPLKHEIVGGHVSLWNAGLLIYNLVLAGFDCSNASIKTYDYNISVIAQKKTFKIPNLIYDKGDLITLQPYMPNGLTYDLYGHFDGNIKEHNW